MARSYSRRSVCNLLALADVSSSRSISSLILPGVSKYICPDVGGIRRIMVLPSVVLPQPDSPTRPIQWPCSMARSIPSTALTAPAGLLRIPFRIAKCVFRFLVSTRTFTSSSLADMAGDKVPWCHFTHWGYMLPTYLYSTGAPGVKATSWR
ncbi:hypothetical protein ES703_87890 [subsurface metagenome]